MKYFQRILRENQNFVTFLQNFLILFENLPHNLLKTFSKFSVNFVRISLSKFS